MLANRRAWLASVTGAVASGLALGGGRPASALAERPEPTPAHLPRWRGFNLLSYFNVGNREPFPREDLEAVAELGFDFVRLPMDYRCWVVDGDWKRIDAQALATVDDVVAWGEPLGVHVQVNLHRAPGYTVASPPEPKRLWADAEALDVCCQHWAHLAKRYQGRPNRQVSFNLFNEPDDKVTAEQHRRVVEAVAQAIRAVDPSRLIVCDGRAWARIPPAELAGLGVAASLHGYEPMPVTHYRANWIPGSDQWAEPTWPLDDNGRRVDRELLKTEQITPWKQLEGEGFGVHVGEFGCHNRTPHPVVLAWMRDVVANYREAGWGWALWNLRGSFGILDSQRRDVRYGKWRGHALDEAMLEVLRAG